MNVYSGITFVFQEAILLINITKIAGGVHVIYYFVISE